MITAPSGFRAVGIAAGIKPQGGDLALLVADRVCAAAGVFTTNRAQAAPVLVSKEHLAGGRARAVVVNAGCANAGTGAAGVDAARAMAAATAEVVGCAPGEVVVCSTGVIGVPLPLDRVKAGIAAAFPQLSREGGPSAARAIMTTDTRPKETLVEIVIDGTKVRLGAMAKGAGMIAPNMATMLAFFTTDADVAPKLLQQALREAVGESLNRITVDGDTSTNDTAVILASGASGVRIDGPGPAFDVFRNALTRAAWEIAEKIVRDGEGATRVAEIRVEGAAAPAEADRIARAIAESPLVKTALYGGDPNWGRILAAAGRAGVPFDVGGVDVFLGALQVVGGGAALPYDEAVAKAAVVEDPVRIRLVLREGTSMGWMWFCDFSHGYVDVNAHYRS